MGSSYKFRLYLTEEQKETIQKNFGSARFVFNHFLSICKEKHEKGKAWSAELSDCEDALEELKNETPWLKEADANTLTFALHDLEEELQGFSRRTENGEEPDYPKFRTKKEPIPKLQDRRRHSRVRGQNPTPRTGFCKMQGGPRNKRNHLVCHNLACPNRRILCLRPR